MTEMLQNIAEFHTKFGLDYRGRPRDLPPKLQKFRDDFITEEFLERVRAQGIADKEERDEKDLDACVDLVYVVMGYCYLRGWDFDKAWSRVHERNMKKERVLPNDPRARSEWDVVKPVGWTPASLKDLITQ